MTDTNTLVITGRLTRDAELKYTNTGIAIGRFSIASNRRAKVNGNWTDKASFFDVVSFGKSAENIHPYLLKGKWVLIQGAVVMDEYEKDGQKRHKFEIVADEVKLLSPKQDWPVDHGQKDEPSYEPQHGTKAEEFPDEIPF